MEREEIPGIGFAVDYFYQELVEIFSFEEPVYSVACLFVAVLLIVHLVLSTTSSGYRAKMSKETDFGFAVGPSWDHFKMVLIAIVVAVIPIVLYHIWKGTF